MEINKIHLGDCLQKMEEIKIILTWEEAKHLDDLLLDVCDTGNEEWNNTTLSILSKLRAKL